MPPSEPVHRKLESFGKIAVEDAMERGFTAERIIEMLRVKRLIQP